MPKISVVVPVYKVEKYLNRCVDSILNQTFTDFELILVDDGSPDNCGKICDEYATKDDRIVVIHKENGGLSDARNKGIDWAFANSDSEWITFIDSDDWVHRQYLELLYKTAIENDVLISCCGFRRVSNDNINEKRIEDYSIVKDAPDVLISKGYSFEQYNISVAWARLYKRDLLGEIRYPFGKLHEDEYTTYKLIYQCEKIAIVKKNLYYYFQNENSIVHSDMSITRLNDLFDAIFMQLEYYYGCFINTFKYKFSLYCKSYEVYLKKYSKNSGYKNFFKRNKKRIKQIIKRRNYLPELLKKYGYKKWATGRANRIESFKKDITSIRREKGFCYAILWAVKNRRTIKE